MLQSIKVTHVFHEENSRIDNLPNLEIDKRQNFQCLISFFLVISR